MVNYTPVNYGRWNLDGKGENIFHLLSQIELKIWNSALPFQDKRDDKGHAEFVTYFAFKLLEQVKAERGVVIPAAILHDTGWSQMSETELKLFYDKNWQRYESILRERHQEEGVNLAEKILKGEYEQFTPQILEIISQHDTRKGFLNVEDGVVRDADKLWRYTLPHFKLAEKERGWSYEEQKKIMQANLCKEGFFYSLVSRENAEIEIGNLRRIVNQ